MPSVGLIRLLIGAPADGLEALLIGSVLVSTLVAAVVDVALVVACEGAADVVLDETGERAFGSGLALPGDVGPSESLVFFFLRRLPKVGMVRKLRLQVKGGPWGDSLLARERKNSVTDTMNEPTLFQPNAGSRNRRYPSPCG